MKAIIKTISVLLIFISTTVYSQDLTQLVAQCAANAGNVTYLKDFVVKLDAGTLGGAPPTARFAMILSKNAMYRFSICTAPDSDGDAVLQLMDMNRLLVHLFRQQVKNFHILISNVKKQAFIMFSYYLKKGKQESL